MIKKIRQAIIRRLWNHYRSQSQQVKVIELALHQKKINFIPLDHFAIIDLPGKYSGIPTLSRIFSEIGFVKRGADFLQEKQNDFIWMAEEDYPTLLAHESLPQVVVADFRLNLMPKEIQLIIEKYVSQAKPFNFDEFHFQLSKVQTQSQQMSFLIDYVTDYILKLQWQLPTIQEFKTVQSFNELLSWVLIFGKQPNHFTYAIHLSSFQNLETFLNFISDELRLELNQTEGHIKGSQAVGIQQASTIGEKKEIQLADGKIELASHFVEFVWRYPTQSSSVKYWRDYYPDFIATHANKVIESLYLG